MNPPKATNNFNVYAENNRKEMLSFIPSTVKSLLDVGCSAGNFGHLLKSVREIEVWGVEVNNEAASIASQKLDKVINNSFKDNLDLPENNFDCVVFNDVLEHLVDPYSALTYAKTLLKKDGKVVASIPNIRYFENMWLLLMHKNWEYTDTGVLDRTHLRFFTKKSIISTFESLEYKVDLIKGINPLENFAPYFMRKFNFFNILTLKNIEDMRWMQFAVVATPNKFQFIDDK